MYHRRIGLSAVLLAAASALAGCQPAKPEAPKFPPPVVTVIRPAVVPVRDYWVYNGYLDTTKAVEVRSKIRGFLKDVKFTEGAEVAVNTPLYTIDKLEYETSVKKASAELLKSEAQIKSWDAQIIQARADLERVNRLGATGTESKFKEEEARATLDVRIAELKAAEANRDAAKAALHSAEILLGYTDIRAKIGGRISRTLVDEGNLVQADTTLLTTIVQVDKLYVYYDAPETDFLAYQKTLIRSSSPSMSTQQIGLEVGVGDEMDFPHEGAIDFRENRVETATGTIRVRGRLDNPLLTNGVRLLYPGMFARIRVPKSDKVPTPVIPEDCLLSGQEGRFVFVVNAEGIVKKRLVTVGANFWKVPAAEPGVAAPSWVAVNPKPAPPKEGQPPAETRKNIKSVVAITAGLKPDDRVILAGLHAVRPDAPAVPDEWVFNPPADGAKK
ncbi:efflux RND transporter periplasmic adaptor subunit [Gemmata sp. G18]|uniref:Efflux RND transporter periplasmic adaptor subunit n=1 Tax=Gemmata palustris TaxID=2822762 RepID=A0ABS5BRR6_9BACT|nr:efflux RND transporter periplasmic adaptor subunit [Gemmata palustris]MBP3956378.1 efflux RND transporter periplasmic adaptor subunit [Gemmata palustris]